MSDFKDKQHHHRDDNYNRGYPVALSKHYGLGSFAIIQKAPDRGKHQASKNSSERPVNVRGEIIQPILDKDTRPQRNQLTNADIEYRNEYQQREKELDVVPCE